jgi:hypothetical protein
MFRRCHAQLHHGDDAVSAGKRTGFIAMAGQDRHGFSATVDWPVIGEFTWESRHSPPSCSQIGWALVRDPDRPLRLSTALSNAPHLTKSVAVAAVHSQGNLHK